MGAAKGPHEGRTMAQNPPFLFSLFSSLYIGKKQIVNPLGADPCSCSTKKFSPPALLKKTETFRGSARAVSFKSFTKKGVRGAVFSFFAIGAAGARTTTTTPMGRETTWALKRPGRAVAVRGALGILCALWQDAGNELGGFGCGAHYLAKDSQPRERKREEEKNDVPEMAVLMPGS